MAYGGHETEEVGYGRSRDEEDDEEGDGEQIDTEGADLDLNETEEEECTDEEDDDEDEELDSYGLDEESQERFKEMILANTPNALLEGCDTVAQHSRNASSDLIDHILNIMQSLDIFPQMYAKQLQTLGGALADELVEFISVIRRAIDKSQHFASAIFHLTDQNLDVLQKLHNLVRVKGLESHLDSLRSAGKFEILVKFMQNQMVKLRSDYDDVLEEYGEECEKSIQLGQEVGDLKAKIATLEEQSTAGAEIESLKAKVAEQEEQLSKGAAAATESQKQITALEKQVADLNQQLQDGLAAVFSSRRSVSSVEVVSSGRPTDTGSAASAAQASATAAADPPAGASPEAAPAGSGKAGKGKAAKGTGPPPPGKGAAQPAPPATLSLASSPGAAPEGAAPTASPSEEATPAAAPEAPAKGKPAGPGAKGKSKGPPPPGASANAGGASAAPAAAASPSPGGKGPAPPGGKGPAPPGPGGKGPAAPSPGGKGPAAPGGKGAGPPPKGGKGGPPGAKGGKGKGAALPPVDPGPEPPKDMQPRKFHWTNIIGQRYQTSLFALLANPPEGAPKPRKVRLDFDSLTASFFARKKAAQAVETTSAAKDKKKVATCLEGKKCQAVEIFLNGCGVTLDQVKKCVISLDEASLSVEHLGKVMELYPKDEELTQLQTFQEENDPKVVPWGRAEDFLVSLMKIPEFMKRAECCQTKGTFTHELNSIKQDVTIERDCLRSLVKSTSLFAIFDLVVQVGNFLNFATPKGAQRGFTLDTLPLLMRVEGFNDKTYTLMRFLMDTLEANRGIRDSAVEDMKLCDAASKLDFEELQRRLGELEKNVALISVYTKPSDTKALGTSVIADAQFEMKFQQFVLSSQQQLHDLRTIVNEVAELCKECIDLYAEKPKTKIEEVLVKFKDFRKDMEEARRQNLLAKAKKEKADKRRAEKEAAAKKPKSGEAAPPKAAPSGSSAKKPGAAADAKDNHHHHQRQRVLRIGMPSTAMTSTATRPLSALSKEAPAVVQSSERPSMGLIGREAAAIAAMNASGRTTMGVPSGRMSMGVSTGRMSTGMSTGRMSMGVTSRGGKLNIDGHTVDLQELRQYLGVQKPEARSPHSPSQLLPPPPTNSEL